MRRQVAVGGGEVRRPLGVRAVVGAAGGHADHADAEVGEHPEQPVGFGEVEPHPRAVASEGMVGALLRDSGAVRPGDMRGQVEGAQTHADRKAGNPMADGLDRPSQEPGAAHQVPSERAGPPDARQQFVDQVAVAGLHVHEGEAGVVGYHRRLHEVAGQPLEVVVGHHALPAGTDPAVKQRMTVGGARRSIAPGPCPATGVRELQSDQQVVGRPEALDVCVHEDAPEVGEVAGRVRADAELVRVGPALRRHRHGLAPPDQLGATTAEPRPAASDQVGGPAVAGAVPALHRQDRPTIADVERSGRAVVHGQSVGQWPRGVDLVVERQVETEGGQVPGERSGVGESPNLDRRHQAMTPIRRPRSARAPRSPSGRRTATSGTRSESIHPRSRRNWAALCR